MTEKRAVVRLQPGDEAAAADALVAGHAEYPAFRHVFPDHDRRLRALRPFFTATVRDAIRFGVVYAAVDDDRVQAAAVWLPPGAFPWSVRRQLRAAPAFLRVVAAAPRSFPTFMRYGSNAARAHPIEPHWYLVVLSVRPDAQRRGLGTGLLTPVLTRADSKGVPCYLESSDHANVAFYERTGFVLLGEVALVPDGPTHVAMRRPAMPQPGSAALPTRGAEDRS